jgi:putative hydrolase of the HAD superfamily
MSAPVPFSPPPDFRHVRTWVFDLDHTLYTLDHAQHGAMEERICVFVQNHFGLPRDAAWEIQKRYLRDYGSTIAGLVRHDGVDPDIYHEAVNDLAALSLTPNAPLRAALERLPGQRLVFTNNCGRYAANVLKALGIDDLFGTIVDVRALDYVPKPQESAYDTLFQLGGFAPQAAALFDDSVRNLIPARARGMTTVWFNNGGGQSHWRVDDQALHIDHETDDLAAFLHAIRISP